MSLAAASVIVSAQPIGAPWWYHADADATYAASALNLAAGDHVVFLGHPGLPLQEGLAAAFLLEYAGERVTGDPGSIREFVDGRLSDLDRTRVIFRGLGIISYLVGAVVLCLAAARVAGSWTLGAAGGLLWVGAPNLAPMSIQYRPDVAFAVGVVCAGLLLGRAATARSVGALAAAAAVIGFAVTVKAHALGLLLPLAVIAALRPPRRLGIRETLTTVGLQLRRHRTLAALVIGLWATAAAVLNRGQVYVVTTAEAVTAVALMLGVAAISLAWLERAPRAVRVTAVVISSFCCGLLVSASFAIHDGIAGIAEVARTATGGGVNANEGVEAGNVRALFEPLLRQMTLLFALAGVAAAIGWRRGDVRPAVWFASATVLGGMALGRLGTPHYFAPTFVLSVLGVLWLCSRLGRIAGVILAAALAVWIVGVQFRYRDGSADALASMRATAGPVYQRELGRLADDSVILTPSQHIYLPVPDTHYFEFVRPYVVRTSKARYRTLPATSDAARFALALGLDVEDYVGPKTSSLTEAAMARLAVGETPIVQPIRRRELGYLAGSGE